MHVIIHMVKGVSLYSSIQEAQLIEKQLIYEIQKAPTLINDSEPLTTTEHFHLKRIFQKHKINYFPCRSAWNDYRYYPKHAFMLGAGMTLVGYLQPCKPSQDHQDGDEMARLSGGIVIDIMKTILLYFTREELCQTKDFVS